jgi:hypothetical protein
VGAGGNFVELARFNFFIRVRLAQLLSFVSELRSRGIILLGSRLGFRSFVLGGVRENGLWRARAVDCVVSFTSDLRRFCWSSAYGFFCWAFAFVLSIERACGGRENFVQLVRFIFSFRVGLAELTLGAALPEPPVGLSRLFVQAVLTGKMLC